MINVFKIKDDKINRKFIKVKVIIKLRKIDVFKIKIFKIKLIKFRINMTKGEEMLVSLKQIDVKIKMFKLININSFIQILKL